MLLLWFLAIVLFVYVSALKLRDYSVQPHDETGGGASERVTIEQLEAATQLSPSFQNRVRLAWALYEEGQYGRARDCFELALRSHPKDNDARYGVGLCALEQGKLDEANESLGMLVERSFAFDDYRAAEALAETLFRAEQNDEAAEVLAAVAKSSRRIEHRIAHAKLLQRAGRRADASAVLERALSDFEAQPDHIRRREGAHATEARRLLRTL